MSLVHRILILEDEHVLAENMKAFLDRRSPDVRIAENRRCAMRILSSFTPDVVVLDYGLPEGNGLQFYLEMMRLRNYPIGCVMITGYPLEIITPFANKLGIRHFLGKPFSLSELQYLVELSASESSPYVH